MPVRRLAAQPKLQDLESQAKDLLRSHAAGDLAVAQLLREFHPRFDGASDAAIFACAPTLNFSDAQMAIAREAGFPSWARLEKHIESPGVSDRLDLPHHERIEDATFRRALQLLDAGDADGLRAWLEQHPALLRQRVVFEGGNYFRDPTLLEFVAENPVRHGKLPKNIVEIAKVILDSCAASSVPDQSALDRAALNETLILVATGSVPRECGVQLALIDLLCDHGADPDGALRSAVLLGEMESASALIRRGGRVDLPVAAGLGRTEDARRLLPSASSVDRQIALSVAANYSSASSSHVEIVRLLLDAGEDPNRYNPPGGHSHTTPLHQAAAYGTEEVVRLLVERGARVDMKDVLWRATPADWAQQQGRKEIEAYLRAQEKAREAARA